MGHARAARRYAKALFGLASDENRVDVVQQELAQLVALVAESSELRHALLRPLHPVTERKAVLGRVAERLGTSDTVRHFYAFLIEQRRFVDLDAIDAEYRRLADLAAGRLRAEVVSAKPLSDAQRERLRRVLSDQTGGHVELDARVDPELLGGAVAKVGDLIFDGSLRTQLHQLRANLTKGQ
jgi:F-type H+-transporting ATPase subunit delta